MRLIIVSPVYQGAESRRHLGHGNIKPLSEGTGGKVHIQHIFFIKQESLRIGFSRKVDPCIFSEAEDVLIPQEMIHPDLFRHMHHRHIAGVGHRILYGLGPVPGLLVAGDVIVPHMKTPIACIGFVPLQDPRFQSCRHGHRLDRGPGFKGIADAEISPQVIHGRQLFLLRHGAPLFPGIQDGQIPRIVQIKIRVGRLRQDRPGIRIHDHDRRILAAKLSRAGFPGMLLIELPDALLHHALQRDINGGYHRIAVFGCLHSPFNGRVVVKISVFPSVCPVQDVIIGTFDADRAFICAYHKTDHIACQTAVRVASLVILLQPDAPHVRIILIVLIDRIKFLGLFIGNLFGQDLIPAVGPFLNDLLHRSLRNAEYGFQHLHGRLFIFFLRQHHIYIQDHIVDPFAGCHPGSVAVYDIPPLVGDDPAVVLLLFQHDLRVAASFRGIDICNFSD